MKWTQAARYRPYQEWSEEYVKDLKRKVTASKWRLNYHVQPETGLLNDPNGFSYSNGKWHLFYQSFPFGAIHGLKSWFHITSKDLVHWEVEGPALEPDSVYDSHGVYSGSAIPVEEKLFLAYTGNVRDETWERHSYQLGAWMNNNGTVTKLEIPLISAPPLGYTAHFRDPQIIQYEDEYLMVIGGQTNDEKGNILIYRSQNLIDWTYRGPLALNQDLGFMVECPNLLFIDGKLVILLCPQGMGKSVLEYQNVYPNTYILAEDYIIEENRLEHPLQQQLLDEGFDLYATQAFNAPDGRCLSVGWIGLPEMDYPTFNEGWAHSLSLIKELTLKKGKLYQYPVAETKQLRKTKETFILEPTEQLRKTTNNCYELQLIIPKNSHGEIHLFSDKTDMYALILSYDTEEGKLQLDRRNTHYPLNPAFGEIRESLVAPSEAMRLSIFVDQSTCEIFINHGERVLTANYYPEENQKELVVKGTKNISITYYSLEK